MVTEDRQTVTHEKEQVLASSETRSSFQVPAGYYEFLFDVPLSSNIMETVTGSEHNYHTYQVDAIIERRYWKDIVVSQPLSIYKLPEVETSHLTTDFPLVRINFLVRRGTNPLMYFRPLKVSRIKTFGIARQSLTQQFLSVLYFLWNAGLRYHLKISNSLLLHWK